MVGTIDMIVHKSEYEISKCTVMLYIFNMLYFEYVYKKAHNLCHYLFESSPFSVVIKVLQRFDQRVTKIQIKEISVKRLMKKFTVGNFILMSFGVNNVAIHFMLN